MQAPGPEKKKKTNKPWGEDKGEDRRGLPISPRVMVVSSKRSPARPGICVWASLLGQERAVGARVYAVIDLESDVPQSLLIHVHQRSFHPDLSKHI